MFSWPIAIRRSVADRVTVTAMIAITKRVTVQSRIVCLFTVDVDLLNNEPSVLDSRECGSSSRFAVGINHDRLHESLVCTVHNVTFEFFQLGGACEFDSVQQDNGGLVRV